LAAPGSCESIPVCFYTSGFSPCAKVSLNAAAPIDHGSKNVKQQGTYAFYVSHEESPC
jgi:hypothetical protein